MQKQITLTVLALCVCLIGAQFNNQGQFVNNGQPFAGNNQQAGNSQLGLNPGGGQPNGAFPPQNQGFPPQTQGRFPPQTQGGFPPQTPGAFPPQNQGQQQAGFPQQGQQPGGFPQQGQQPGTFPQPGQQPGGFPQPQPGFPPQNQGGFPPQNQGFPPQGQQNGQVGVRPQVGIGGFQPNAPGGFGTVGNRFGNPFIPGNSIGSPLPGAGAGNGQNQFTASGQLFMSLSQNPNNYRYATCYFNSTGNTIRGRADFRQFLFGDSGVDIRVQVVGLPTSPVDTQRGIHIHEYGDTGEGCARVGPHFNPTQTRHGGRNSYPFLRHVGDLGNMLQSAQGVASTQFRDTVISLQGQGSILGRSLVIKYERDDEGTGTNSASLQNGNARTPIACCTIGRASPANWRTPYSEEDLMRMSGGAWSPSSGTQSAASATVQGSQPQSVTNPGQTVPGSMGTQGNVPASGLNNQGSGFNNGGTSGFSNNFGGSAGGSNNAGQSFGFLGNTGKK